MSNIYLIIKHDGMHDDYRETPIKAFEDKDTAETLVIKYNQAIDPINKKINQYYFDTRQQLLDIEEKFNCWDEDDEDMENYDKMCNSQEYKDMISKQDKYYESLCNSFPYEKFDYINEPITYSVKKIELIEK